MAGGAAPTRVWAGAGTCTSRFPLTGDEECWRFSSADRLSLSSRASSTGVAFLIPRSQAITASVERSSGPFIGVLLAELPWTAGLSRQTSVTAPPRTVKPVPRRAKPDPFSLQIGKRIRELRLERGLTMERLAYESELGSKGHLSNIEKGLVRPTAHTLKVLADALDLLPLDLLTFPTQDARQQLIDRTRHVDGPTLRRWLAEGGDTTQSKKRKSRR